MVGIRGRGVGMDVVLGREVDMGGSRGGFVEAVAVDMGGGMMM